MKRLLFIAYHLPPHGGAGVQRSLKFLKYLPAFGVRPTVLTGFGRGDRKWSPADRTLEKEIPAEIMIARTTWPVGPYGAQRSVEEWRLTLAARLIEARRLEAIFVSMSPFSDAAFAARLSARCGIPWVADLRDPWALDEFQVYRSRWHRQRAFGIMQRALASASLIVMNTPESAAALTRTFPEFEGRTVSITNGYDAADLAPAPVAHASDKFTIVHAGFLHATAGLQQQRRAWQYRLLGRMEAGVEILPRSHYYLLRALERWRAENPEIESRVRLLLVGESRPLDREIVARSSVASLITFAGYLPHAESVRVVREADLLFLPMHKLPPGQRATIVPGKVYEYLASGRPILAAVPAGDARDFLASAGSGLVCEPDDPESMVKILRAQFTRWSHGEAGPFVDGEYIARFERRELTRQLAERLNALPATIAADVPSR